MDWAELFWEEDLEEELLDLEEELLDPPDDRELQNWGSNAQFGPVEEPPEEFPLEEEAFDCVEDLEEELD